MANHQTRRKVLLWERVPDQVWGRPWAENDEFQKPIYATLLHQTLPNSRLVWIKQAEHWLMEERADEVSDHLVEFLNA